MTTGRDHRRLDRIAHVLAAKRKEERIRQHYRRQAAVLDLVAAAKALAGGPNDHHRTWRPEPQDARWEDEAHSSSRPGPAIDAPSAEEQEAARRRAAADKRANFTREMRGRLKGYQLSGAEAAQLVARYPELREEPWPATPPPPKPLDFRPEANCPPHPDDPWPGGGFLRPSHVK